MDAGGCENQESWKKIYGEEIEGVPAPQGPLFPVSETRAISMHCGILDPIAWKQMAQIAKIHVFCPKIGISDYGQHDDKGR